MKVTLLCSIIIADCPLSRMWSLEPRKTLFWRSFVIDAKHFTSFWLVKQNSFSQKQTIFMALVRGDCKQSSLDPYSRGRCMQLLCNLSFRRGCAKPSGSSPSKGIVHHPMQSPFRGSCKQPQCNLPFRKLGNMTLLCRSGHTMQLLGNFLHSDHYLPEGWRLTNITFLYIFGHFIQFLAKENRKINLHSHSNIGMEDWRRWFFYADLDISCNCWKFFLNLTPTPTHSVEGNQTWHFHADLIILWHLFAGLDISLNFEQRKIFLQIDSLPNPYPMGKGYEGWLFCVDLPISFNS